MLTFVKTNYRNIVAQMAITICDIWPKTTLVTNFVLNTFWPDFLLRESQYFLAQFSFERGQNFGISICQRRSKCFDLAECALEKACLQRGGPSELSLGRANISTAPWKSINKAQTETYRGSRDKILRCVQGVGRGTTLRGRDQSKVDKAKSGTTRNSWKTCLHQQ